MELIYPSESLKIFIPHELNGELGKTIFEIAHRHPETTLYWHIDNVLCGVTKGIHSIEVSPTAGKHVLCVVDQDGGPWFVILRSLIEQSDAMVCAGISWPESIRYIRLQSSGIVQISRVFE